MEHFGSRLLTKIEFGRDVGLMGNIVLSLQLVIGMVLLFFFIEGGHWLLAILFALSAILSFGIWIGLSIILYLLILQDWLLVTLSLAYAVAAFSWVSLSTRHSQNPENTIQWIEKTYRLYRRRHPGEDEHLYLANTWLHRYKDTERSVPEANLELSAWTETSQFAVLDPPDSYRALAVYLVLKELGSEIPNNYQLEFGRLMAPVYQAQEEGSFDDLYATKNPKTRSIS